MSNGKRKGGSQIVADVLSNTTKRAKEVMGREWGSCSFVTRLVTACGES